jgi:hypothetical protein
MKKPHRGCSEVCRETTGSSAWRSSFVIRQKSRGGLGLLGPFRAPGHSVSPRSGRGRKAQGEGARVSARRNLGSTMGDTSSPERAAQEYRAGTQRAARPSVALPGLFRSLAINPGFRSPPPAASSTLGCGAPAPRACTGGFPGCNPEIAQPQARPRFDTGHPTFAHVLIRQSYFEWIRQS